MAQQIRYTARRQMPYFLVRARDTAIDLEVYDESTGLIVTPASATVSVVDDEGTSVVDAAAATITNSRPSYTVLAADVPATLNMSDKWQVRWAVTVGNVVHTFNEVAHLSRWEATAPVTVPDLLELHQALPDFSTPSRSHERVLADGIRTGFADVARRLIREGKRPERILNGYALFEVTRARALHRIFRDAGTSLGEGRYTELADEYREEYERLWAGLRLDLDLDDDATLADDEKARAGTAILYTGGRATAWR